MKRVEVIPMTRKEIRAEMGNLEPWMEICIPGIYWGVSKPKSLVGVNEPRLLGFSHDMDYYMLKYRK